MKYSKLVIILILLLFLLSCVKQPTGLLSYEDYEDILAYENSTVNENSLTFEKEENNSFIEENEFNVREEPVGFRTRAVKHINICSIVSFIPGIVAGDIVILDNDITETAGGDCIEIDIDNITLDCDGHSIKGMPGNSDNGIFITGKNVEVQNCTIWNFTKINSDGIEVGFIVTGATVNFTNNHIYNVNRSGIFVDGTEGNYTIKNLTVHDADYGVYFDAGLIVNANVSITESYFYNIFGAGDSAGVRSEMFGGNFLIKNNIFLSEDKSAIYLKGHNAGSKIENFTISNNQFNLTPTGSVSEKDVFARYVENIIIKDNNISRIIYADEIAGINITRNIFEDNTLAGNVGRAINIEDHSENISITHNQLPKEIRLSQNKNQTVYNNSFEGNARINVIVGSDTYILENIFSNVFITDSTSGGVLLDRTENSTVDKNKILNGLTYSIDILGDNNNATNNLVENTTGFAFKVKGNNNYIYNNTIKNHTGTGFWIQGINNTFFRNNITINLKMMNTSFNYDNVSGPYSQVEESGDVFLLLNNTRTNITSNTIKIFNPLNLRIGIYGIRTVNFTSNNIGAIIPATTNNLEIFNNTFGTITGFGLKTAIKLWKSYNAQIYQNFFYNTEHETIIIKSGQNNNISNNTITGNYNTNPYYSETGIKLFKTTNNTIQHNNITNYDTGIYCYNSSLNNYSLNNITKSSRNGMFFFRCMNETINTNTIINATAGIKLLYTNYSIFSANIINQTKIGFDLNQAHNNTFTTNTQDNSTIGLNLDLFSLGNIFNNNIFDGTDVDILYDMFARNNTGAGNTFATTRTENYAAGNTIS